jgi:hypothetical protein
VVEVVVDAGAVAGRHQPMLRRSGHSGKTETKENAA